MEVIIHKVLSDLKTLLAELWQALWHHREPGPPEAGPSKRKTR